MTSAFVDSSAYVNFFIDEPDSRELIDFFERSSPGTIFISVVAEIEVRSAIRRRRTEGDLDDATGAFAIATLTQRTTHIIQYPVSPEILWRTRRIVDRHPLRALDSIQLATALTVRASLPEQASLRFIASDVKLLQSAEREGLATWNRAITATQTPRLP